MWKDINGWEEYYEINEFGEIRNKLNNKLIIGDTNSAGYQRVQLQNKNHDPLHQRFFRHRLVAEHFIPNPNNLPEVNHIINDLNNNTVENLEWTTRELNELHSRKYGSKSYKPFIVHFTNGINKQYDVKPSLAKELNVTRATIKNWLMNKNTGYEKYNIESIRYI